MEWIDVNDELPIIPEGRHGISVLGAIYDEVYAELSGTDGYHVSLVMYSNTKGCKHYLGKKEYDFMVLYYAGNGDWGWGNSVDNITHWMLLPEPPKVKPIDK